MADDARENRAARNEDMFRQVNDRLHILSVIDGASEPLERFVCECERANCSLLVELTANEYRAVRSDGARFLVYPEAEHTSPEVEIIVEQRPRYWVVEKLGEAGEAAEELAEEGPRVL